MPVCCINNCPNRTGSFGSGQKQYFSFPEDPVLRGKWMIACGKTEETFKAEHGKVCQDHFEEECFEENCQPLKCSGKRNKLGLIQGSVPTRLLILQKRCRENRRERTPLFAYKELVSSLHQHSHATSVSVEEHNVCENETCRDAFIHLHNKMQELEKKNEALEEVEPQALLPSCLVTVKMEVESEEDGEGEEEEEEEVEENADAEEEQEEEEVDATEGNEQVTEPVEFVRIKEEHLEEEEEIDAEKYDEEEDWELRMPATASQKVTYQADPEEEEEIDTEEYDEKKDWELRMPSTASQKVTYQADLKKSVTNADPLDLTTRQDVNSPVYTPINKTGKKGKGSNCPHCKLLFVDDASVEVHVKTCQQTLKNKRFKCETCGAAVSSAASLRRHKQTHTGKRPHHCEMCGASFKRLSHLRDHKLSHTGEKKHVCNTCGSAFTQLSNLRTHERHHAGESSRRVRRLFRCDICGAEFGYNSSLKMHLLNHTGERPFECDICKASFKQFQSLTVHKRRHTGERPFQCDVCGSTFAHLQGLRVHKRIHTGERPYKCDVCEAAFTQLHSLSTHKRRHNDVRPYSCDVCNASFVTKDKMRYHIRIHTGEKPYACPICGKAFTTASDLTRHKRIHVPKVNSGNVNENVGNCMTTSATVPVTIKKEIS